MQFKKCVVFILFWGHVWTQSDHLQSVNVKPIKLLYAVLLHDIYSRDVNFTMKPTLWVL